jgi:hypothetical protein
METKLTGSHSRLQDWSCGVDNFNKGRVFVELAAPNTYQTVSLTPTQAIELGMSLISYATSQQLAGGMTV